MFCIYFFNISDILFNACFIPLRIIIKLSKFLNIDITKISIATPSVISIIMYYTNIIMFIIDEKIIKKFILNKKHIRKTIKNIISAISVVFILFIVFEQIYINYFEEYIIYFNVKQGNMALIRKDRKTIIVDLGSTTEQLASQVLNKYLKAKNIKKIDNIFISHFHTDHMNGIYDISSDIKIESVTYGKIWHKINEEYENFVLFAKDNNINLSEVSENDEIKLSKNIFVKCICPRKDEKINSSDEINSNSAVYLFNVNSKENNKFLFMGDATKETEKYILSKNTDDLENIFILQIGHHGSKTSTSDELIRKTSPKISFISAYKKVYNHPSDETLEILNKYKIKCHVTEIDKVLKFKL